MGLSVEYEGCTYEVAADLTWSVSDLRNALAEESASHRVLDAPE